jgi:hypothetical protein
MILRLGSWLLGRGRPQFSSFFRSVMTTRRTVPMFPDQKAIRKVVHPGRLQVHRGLERPLSLVGQDHDLRPAVMRVRFQRDEPSRLTLRLQTAEQDS